MNKKDHRNGGKKREEFKNANIVLRPTAEDIRDLCMMEGELWRPALWFCIGCNLCGQASRSILIQSASMKDPPWFRLSVVHDKTCAVQNAVPSQSNASHPIKYDACNLTKVCSLLCLWRLDCLQPSQAGRTAAPRWRRQKLARWPHSCVRSHPPHRSRTAAENSHANSFSQSSPQTIICPVSSMSQAIVQACVMKVFEFAGPTAMRRSRKLGDGIMSM